MATSEQIRLQDKTYRIKVVCACSRCLRFRGHFTIGRMTTVMHCSESRFKSEVYGSGKDWSNVAGLFFELRRPD